jgi:ABC-type enterochelin transport system permease subunit
MSRVNVTLPLISGFAVVAAAAAALFYALPPNNFITGTVAGVGVAYLGFLLYYFLMPRSGTFLKSYLPGAVVRYVVMIGTFCIVVFMLKINMPGVLLGTFLGMMVSTFISLNTMRRSANNPPAPEE